MKKAFPRALAGNREEKGSTLPKGTAREGTWRRPAALALLEIEVGSPVAA